MIYTVYRTTGIFDPIAKLYIYDFLEIVLVLHLYQSCIRLKAKKPHGFNSCIVIYPLDIPSINKSNTECSSIRPTYIFSA